MSVACAATRNYPAHIILVLGCLCLTSTGPRTCILFSAKGLFQFSLLLLGVSMLIICLSLGYDYSNYLWVDFHGNAILLLLLSCCIFLLLVYNMFPAIVIVRL